jgi:hypothetical protein
MRILNNKGVLILLFAVLIIYLFISLYQLSVTRKSQKSMEMYTQGSLVAHYLSMMDSLEPLIEVQKDGKPVEAIVWKNLLGDIHATEIMAIGLQKGLGIRPDQRSESLKLGSIADVTNYMHSFLSQIFDFYENNNAPFEQSTCKSRVFNTTEDIQIELEKIRALLVETPQNSDGHIIYKYIIDHWDIAQAQDVWLCSS